MIFGGELSTKEIKYEDLTKLFESYVQQIYNKFGEKVNKKQKIDSVGKYKNKRGCCEVAI